jgi:peptide/nickel transport system substrate-binding protein
MTETISRRSAVKLGAVLAAGSAVGFAGEAQAAPKRGGKLIYARYADSLNLDPVFTDANVDIWVLSNLYDTLLSPTHDGKGIEPGLATKWELSDAGKTLTLTLREGVKFADGTPLKPTDVKWSLDRARNPKNGAWSDLVGSIDDVSVAGPTTIVIKLKHADPTILPALATFNTQILPGDKVQAADGTTDEEKAKNFGMKPIGTGPFMLTDWKRGEVMNLKRNPYYWKKAPDGGKLPYVDEIEFPIVPDDATRLLKVKSGEVHGTEFVPYSRVKEMEADPKLRMELWPSTRVSYLTLNCRPTFKDGTKNPMNDARVRKALNFAVNKEAVIAVATLNLGKPMTSFMSSATPMHVGTKQPYPYNPGEAKKLLADAGFAGGFELTGYTLAGNLDYTNIMTTVQQMWGAVGVKMKIEQMDNPTLVAKYRAADFQLRPSAWTDDIADPSEIASYFAYSPNIDCLHSGWKDPTVDSLFVQTQAEIDPKKRAAEYQKLQEIYVSEAPIVFIYETPYPVVWQKTVTGFIQIPLGNNIFEYTSL